MIRGSFRGFVSGWAGILMITFLLGTAVCCCCCYCASIWHTRRKSKRNLPGLIKPENDDNEIETGTIGISQGQPMTNFNGPSAFTYSTPLVQKSQALGEIAQDEPQSSSCPYPIDIAHDGIPRPQFLEKEFNQI